MRRTRSRRAKRPWRTLLARPASPRRAWFVRFDTAGVESADAERGEQVFRGVDDYEDPYADATASSITVTSDRRCTRGRRMRTVIASGSARTSCGGSCGARNSCAFRRPTSPCINEIRLRMTSDQSNNRTSRTRPFEVGDKVEHTNSHRVGQVREVRQCADGTWEMRLDIDFDDMWWNSRRVRNLTAEDEK